MTKTKTEHPTQLLTFTDAGEIAGVGRMTIAKWVDTGVLKSVPMPQSTRRRVQRGVLMAFLDSLSVASKGCAGDE